MARYLLDTDAVIDYVAARPKSVSLIDGLHFGGDVLCTCDVVIAEVYAGLRPQRVARTEKLLLALSFLQTSREIARLAGEWRYAFALRGVALATTDALIAATAHFHQATIVTGNKSHYLMAEVSVLSLPR